MKIAQRRLNGGQPAAGLDFRISSDAHNNFNPRAKDVPRKTAVRPMPRLNHGETPTTDVHPSDQRLPSREHSMNANHQQWKSRMLILGFHEWSIRLSPPQQVEVNFVPRRRLGTNFAFRSDGRNSQSTNRIRPVSMMPHQRCEEIRIVDPDASLREKRSSQILRVAPEWTAAFWGAATCRRFGSCCKLIAGTRL